MPLFRQKQISPLKCHRDWASWQLTPLAQDLLQNEKELLKPFLARKFGNYLLQISIGDNTPLFGKSPIANKTTIQFELPAVEPDFTCVSRPDYLAIANDSIDALILHHVLEFSDNPHQILREAQRALSAGGQLFILGFNPWSLWGLRKKFTFHHQAPWTGHYFSRFRLMDWLRLLDFSHEETRYGYFKLPLVNQKLIQKSRKLEQLGQKYNCFLGSFYVMVARKQVAGMMPLTEHKRRTPIVTFPVAEPTARTRQEPLIKGSLKLT